MRIVKKLDCVITHRTWVIVLYENCMYCTSLKLRALLALSDDDVTIWERFPRCRPLRASNAGFDVFFDVVLNILLNKQWNARWFETLIWLRCKDVRWCSWVPTNLRVPCMVASMHYNDVIIDPMASQITSLTIVYSAVYSGADQRKYQNSASLAFVRGIYRGPVNSPHKWPVTRKMFPFDDVIMGTVATILYHCPSTSKTCSVKITTATKLTDTCKNKPPLPTDLFEFINTPISCITTTDIDDVEGSISYSLRDIAKCTT